MRKSKFSEQQIITILKAVEAGQTQRCLSPTRGQRRDLLQVEDEVRGHGSR
jgi:hypothetical protein